jgi:hypothetical protein
MSNQQQKETYIIDLPSDSSYKIYKNNMLSKFSVYLPETIKLNSDYEVALAQIIYPSNIFNIPYDMSIKYKVKFKNEEIIVVNKLLNKGCYHTEVELINAISKLFNETNKIEIENFLKSIYPNPTFSVINLPKIEFINDIVNCTHGEIKIVRKNKEENTKIVIDFDDYLFHMLGFEDSQLLNLGKAKYYIDMYGQIHTMYVYTDIMQPTIVGHEKANVLRVVALDSPKTSKVNEMKCEHYNAPLFHPLKILNFDTIEIQLLDNRGKLIQFENGKVIITLILKPINYTQH